MLFLLSSSILLIFYISVLTHPTRHTALVLMGLHPTKQTRLSVPIHNLTGSISVDRLTPNKTDNISVPIHNLTDNISVDCNKGRRRQGKFEGPNEARTAVNIKCPLTSKRITRHSYVHTSNFSILFTAKCSSSLYPCSPPPHPRPPLPTLSSLKTQVTGTAY